LKTIWKYIKIIEKYELEKIKSIGDSYMCAGGLPFPPGDHACKIVKAALEITAFVDDSKKLKTDDQIHFDVSIGINTGPVVAAVVGSRKFAYDIWRYTVNIASPMESNSAAGKINVSANTYQLINNEFEC
jgi:class 3 adenylate cyclase